LGQLFRDWLTDRFVTDWITVSWRIDRSFRYGLADRFVTAWPTVCNKNNISLLIVEFQNWNLGQEQNPDLSVNGNMVHFLGRKLHMLYLCWTGNGYNWILRHCIHTYNHINSLTIVFSHYFIEWKLPFHWGEIS
jgi:hypothetical protein